MESSLEGLFKRGAAILREGLLRDEECHDLALGNLDVREMGDRLGINEPEVELVVFNRQPEPVAHEIDIALDRLGGHFQFVGEFAAVWEIAGDQPLVQPHHPLQRGTRELLGFGETNGGFSDGPCPRVWTSDFFAQEN